MAHWKLRKTREQRGAGFGSDEFERLFRHAGPRHPSAALAPAPGRAARAGLCHASPSLAPALAAAGISCPSGAVRVPSRRVPGLLRRVPRAAGSRGCPAQAPMRRQLPRLHVTTGTHRASRVSRCENSPPPQLFYWAFHPCTHTDCPVICPDRRELEAHQRLHHDCTSRCTSCTLLEGGVAHKAVQRASPWPEMCSQLPLHRRAVRRPSRHLSINST